MRWVCVAAVAVLGGCPGTSDDAPDGPPDSDTTGHVGIHLGWTTHNPDAIPGMVGQVRLETASFGLSDVRIVGDAGTAMVGRLPLVWGTAMAPDVHTFVDAPPGIYSRAAFNLTTDGADHSFALTGTVQVEGQPHPFSIHYGGALAVSVELKRFELSPAGEVDAAIRLDFGKLFDQIDFRDLPMVEGTLVLDDSNGQMEDVREAVRDDTFKPSGS